MPVVASAGLEPVNAFPIANTVLVKHFFEGDDVFARLRPYYNGSQYRFEVPVDAFDSLKRFLRTHGYDVGIVDRPERYYIAVPQYSAHPDNVFKDSIRQVTVDGYNCFLLTDIEAVEAAVAEGAMPLDSSPVELHTGTLADFATMR